MPQFNAIARFACSAALALAALPAAAEAPRAATTQAAGPRTERAPKTGRASINGVDYYYEVHGRGEPLLLLHGGLGSIDMFGPVLKQLAETRLVIAVDLHGHGRTPLGARPFRLESMGDDLAVLVRRLGHEKVDVLGYSLGAGVAFRMAAQKPQTVRRLVLASGAFSDDGFYADLKKLQHGVSGKVAPMMKDTPMYKSYAAVAPKVSDFPRLLDALGTFMRTPYDWSADVRKLTMPVMLVYGDSDMFRPEHVVRFYQLLGGGLRDAGWGREGMSKNRLAILPDITHYELFASPRLVTTVLPFLDGRSDAKSWAEQIATK
jgi:pimeloyl-ACP methyl ester carboxylesterase